MIQGTPLDHASVEEETTVARAHQGSIAMRDAMRSPDLIFRLVLALLLMGSGGGQSNITGPIRCPSDGGTYGYTNLTTLRADILLSSAMTKGENGGDFILCPSTTFDFSSKANGSLLPPFNDDIFGSYTSKGAQEPIVIVANNTRIQCGYDGSISNECSFIRGNYHIQVLRGVAGVEIRGLTFRFAKKASIVTAGRGGLITFSSCAWEDNTGTGVFLALETNGAVNITTQKPSPIKSSSPSLSPTKTFQPTKTLLPTRTALPSVTPFPSVLSTIPSTAHSSFNSSDAPSGAPSAVPSNSSNVTFYPSDSPSSSPTLVNSSRIPSVKPTLIPSNSSLQPGLQNSSSSMPSQTPSSSRPSSIQPSRLNASSTSPSAVLSNFSQKPSTRNTNSDAPSHAPSNSLAPSVFQPSNFSLKPSSVNMSSEVPSSAPSVLNSSTLSSKPSLANSTSSLPSRAPSKFIPSNLSISTQQPSPSQPSSRQPSQPSLNSSVSSASPSSFRPFSPSTKSPVPAGPSSNPLSSQTPATIRPSTPSVRSLAPATPSASPQPLHAPSTFRPSVPSASPLLSRVPSTFIPSAPKVASDTPAVPNASPLPTHAPSTFRPSPPSISSLAPANPSTRPPTSQVPSSSQHATPNITSLAPAFHNASAPPTTASGGTITAPTVANITHGRSINLPGLSSNAPNVPVPSTSASTGGASAKPIVAARSFGILQTSQQQVTWNDTSNSDDIFPLPADAVVAKLFGENNGGLRGLQPGGTAFDVTISNCTFLRNTATEAVVLNNGGSLRISESEFYDNNSTSTVVQIVGGTLQLESSNFVNNSFVTYPAPVITDSKSNLDLNTNNCGANNSNAGFKGPTCEGVFALSKAGACKRPSSCEGTCIPFTSLTCSLRVCYSDWGMLVNEINTAAQRGQGGVFILCPMTTFLVDAFSKSQPVIIQQSSTVLQCGDSGLRENSCVIFGGEVQVLILGGATDVIFRGLTMISSSKVSVNATGNSSVKATFADCEWTGHTGSSVIQVYNGRQQIAAGKTGMSLSLQNCTIRDNVISFAALSIQGGVAIVTETLFFGNTAQAGAIDLLDHGKLAVSNSCFAENNALQFPGIVFIDKTSFLALNDNNFGIGNGSTDPKCSAIFEQKGGTCLSNQRCTGNCIFFKASACAATLLPPINVTTRTPTPSLPPSTFPPKPIVSNNCYSKWDRLSFAVRNASAAGVGGVFTICPGTLLNVDLFPQSSVTPIVIGTSNIVIQCGKFGSYNDKCTVYGGTTQFVIVGSPTAVKFKGLNLVGSQVTSVNAFGSANARADFIGCTWARNAGSAAVLVYNGTGVVDPYSRILPSVQHGGMSVGFTNCTFRENMVSFAPVLNLGGSILVNTSLLIGNIALGGAILVLSSGSMALADNCFISNQATLTPGVVFVEKKSSVTLNRNNFGQGNEASHFACKTISVGAKLGSANITGSCLQFEAPKCSIVSTIGSTAPTAKPSGASASDFPSFQPSLSTQAPYGLSVKPTISSFTPTQTCFTQWDALSLAVTAVCSTERGGTFVLCPNTLFNLDRFSNPLITPIQIASSNITLKCGSDGARQNNCVVSGGATQFVIRNTVANVFFVGITMVGSSVLSVEGVATESSVASFIDCLWRDHTGNATILMRQIGPVLASMTIEIENCTIEENNLGTAAMVNEGGTLLVKQSLFLRDKGQEGAIAAYNNATVSLVGSCFISNSATIGPGIVFIDESSTLVSNQRNFGEGNSAGNFQCTSIFKSGFLGRLNGKCVLFGATYCDLALPPLQPTAAPTLPNSCISEWEILSLQIQAVCGSKMSAVFVVCPGTFFDLNFFPDPLITPIQILSSNITLQCGDNGARENHCIVSGGATQFVIRNAVTGIRFIGMTMVDSTAISIYAGATPDSDATFIDCYWMNNMGNATILIRQIGNELDSMKVTIVNSTLQANLVDDAAIVNEGGNLMVDRSILTGNRAQNGAIHGLRSGSLSLIDSCFVNNAATSPALQSTAVLIEGNTSLVDNLNNFGEGNGSCNGVLIFSSFGRGVRQSCEPFTATTCPLSNITFTIPPIPTSSPSKPPSAIQATSQLPSMATNQPTMPATYTRPPTNIKPSLAPVVTSLPHSYSFSYHYNYLVWR